VATGGTFTDQAFFGATTGSSPSLYVWLFDGEPEGVMGLCSAGGGTKQPGCYDASMIYRHWTSERPPRGGFYFSLVPPANVTSIEEQLHDR
jgi:hypothetical protein